jgi:hypothetical protein
LAKAKDGEKKEKWYQDAFNYWEKVENCPLSGNSRPTMQIPSSKLLANLMRFPLMQMMVF